jgi:hypothetical protein
MDRFDSMTAFVKVVESGVSGNLRANNAGALVVAAAVAGQGLILEQTCTVGEDLKAGRLVPVLTEYRLPEGAIRAVYLHSRHLSAKVRSFVDFLVVRFGHDPDWDEWRRGRRQRLAASTSSSPGAQTVASLPSRAATSEAAPNGPNTPIRLAHRLPASDRRIYVLYRLQV